MSRERVISLFDEARKKRVLSTTKKGTSQSKLRSVLNIDMLDILTF